MYANGSSSVVAVATTSSGTYQDFFHGACCLPKLLQVAFAARYTISISNDGTTYGDSHYVLVYNSECQTVVEGGSKSLVATLKVTLSDYSTCSRVFSQDTLLICPFLYNAFRILV